jgi:hypothetical protein
MTNKRKFTVNGLELAVIKPSVAIRQKADIHKSVTFSKLAQAGVIFRDKLFDILRREGVWSDEQEKEHESLREALIDGLEKLEDPSLSKEEKEQLAIGVKATRNLLIILLNDYNKRDEFTVEGRADQAKFEMLVSECTVFNEDVKKKYFASLEDYLDKADSELGTRCASEFAKLYYGYSEEEPEDKFMPKPSEEEQPEVEGGQPS